MAFNLRHRRKSVYGMAILIILSLLTELLLTYENNQIIEKNDTLQKREANAQSFVRL